MSRNPCKHQLLNWGHSGLPYTNHSSLVVQFLNYVWLSETPWTAALQDSQSFTISQSLLKLMPIESVMPSNHLLLCLTPFSFCPQSFPASESFPVSWLFTPVGQWYWNFSFSVSLSSEWIFRLDFLWDWLVWSCSPMDSQESSPAPQFKNINSSALSLMVQLSHPYMWKLLSHVQLFAIPWTIQSMEFSRPE